MFAVIDRSGDDLPDVYVFNSEIEADEYEHFLVYEDVDGYRTESDVAVVPVSQPIWR